MKMIERAFDNLHQFHGVDGETKARLKHQALLKEYLQLQKEFVSRKRNLQKSKEKRESLLKVVTFLRRRRKYLLKRQGFNSEGQKECHEQNSDMERAMLERKRNHIAAAAKYEDKEGVEAQQIVRGALRVEKMPNNFFIDDKGIGKKKSHGMIK